ncbi:MAG: hypothetical protein PVH45_03070 [Candidatus Omnitrophota bacterium]|jgi:hypothetical protein
MRRIAIFLVSVYLLSLAFTAVASAESVFQQIYDSISDWSWSSKKSQ